MVFMRLTGPSFNAQVKLTVAAPIDQARAGFREISMTLRRCVLIEMLAVSELPALTPLCTRKEEFVMAAETELKFRVAPGKLSSVLRKGGLSGRRGHQSKQSLVSTYYDTTTHKLRRHGLTLRRLRAVPNARA